MENSQISKSKVIIPGIDFTPAYLQKGSNNEWRIVFYVLNPAKKRLERIRKRVKPMTNSKTRTTYANRLIFEINKKLGEGWNPFIEIENVNAFKLFTECLDQYLKRIEKLVKDNSFRPDTHRAYASYINIIKSYLEKKKIKNMFIISFNKKFINEYLDWIYNEKNLSPRTHNNHLQFLTTISIYFMGRDYISHNPAESVKKIKEGEKTRKTIPSELRIAIKEYLEKRNKPYLVLCLLTYYCFVRRTEITKLKVEDVFFNSNYIALKQDTSKNKKENFVSIPSFYKNMLMDHVGDANPKWYLFGENFKPSPNQLQPKKISDTWVRMRAVLKFGKQYQFYSLKDTGITDLLNSGVPSLSVRDQARHSELATTEKYIEKRSQVDQRILNSNDSF